MKTLDALVFGRPFALRTFELEQPAADSEWQRAVNAALKEAFQRGYDVASSVATETLSPLRAHRSNSAPGQAKPVMLPLSRPNTKWT